MFVNRLHYIFDLLLNTFLKVRIFIKYYLDILFLALTRIRAGEDKIEYWRSHVDSLTYEDNLLHFSGIQFK